MSESENNFQLYQGTAQPEGFPPIPKDWISEWEVLNTSCNQFRLFAFLHRNEPWQGPRALIVIHGQGEHSGRYLHFPHYLQKAVDAIYCFDLRGHGRSEGLRGHVDRFDHYVDDAVMAIQRLDKRLLERFGRSEIHLLGHSLGGLIALHLLFLQQNLPIKSATISAPLLGLRVPVPVLKKYLVYSLSRVGTMAGAQFLASIQMNTDLDASLLSHDVHVPKAYRADKLIHSKVTPRFFSELQKAMRMIQKKKNSTIFSPLQFLVPLDDQIVDPNASLSFFQSVQCLHKQCREYPGFYHESFNEKEKEKAFNDLSEWMLKNRSL